MKDKKLSGLYVVLEDGTFSPVENCEIVRLTQAGEDEMMETCELPVDDENILDREPLWVSLTAWRDKSPRT